jgi:hypothetical protein
MKIRFQLTIQIDNRSQKVKYCYLNLLNQNLASNFNITFLFLPKTSFKIVNNEKYQNKYEIKL